MIFAAALQLLGLGLTLVGAPLTGVGCCLTAMMIVAGERLHQHHRED